MLRKPEMFHSEVQMYVFDSLLDDGRKLTDVINTDHVNVKNLPGHVIPTNVVRNKKRLYMERECSLHVQKFLGREGWGFLLAHHLIERMVSQGTEF